MTLNACIGEGTADGKGGSRRAGADPGVSTCSPEESGTVLLQLADDTTSRRRVM
jgi:hypothetical protein